MNPPRVFFCCAALSALAFSPLSAVARQVDFAREVRPILERSCFGCHGPDKQKSGYRLDVREIAIKGGDSGEPAIVPHDEGSPLIRYVGGEDDDMLMPPKKSDVPPLTAEQVETLRAWIDAGPTWPDEFAGSTRRKPHWSLVPLVKPAVPGHGESDRRFRRCEARGKGSGPSPEADARTLIRRLSYDLTGLPPTPEDVEAFRRGQPIRALMKSSWTGCSPRRATASTGRGTGWTSAHYADTHGNDHDYAAPQRVAVSRLRHPRIQRRQTLRALRAGAGRRRRAFSRRSAGHGRARLPRRRAVGRHADGARCARTRSIIASAQNLDRDDMVSTVMSTFQSLTVHCARCHNHKFDPISQREYYALQAVFAGVDRADRPFDADPRDARPTGANCSRERQRAGHRGSGDAGVARFAGDRRGRSRRLRKRGRGARRRGRRWKSSASSPPAARRSTRQADGSWFVERHAAGADTYIVTARTAGREDERGAAGSAAR